MHKKRGRIVAASLESTTNGYIRKMTWAAPAADSAINIFSYTAAGTSTTVSLGTIVSLSASGLDFPRTVALNISGTTADITSTAWTLVGTDIEDTAITDTVTPTVNTGGTHYTTKAFKTLTSVSMPTQDGNGVKVSVGGGPSLGLDRKTYGGVQAIVGAWKTATGEATASAAATSGTDVALCVVNFNTAYDGSATYGVWFVTSDVR